jgi:RNA polymerase sigma factor (sigma-70 family)
MKVQERGAVSTATAAIPMPDTGNQVSQLFADHQRRVLTAAYRITGNMADAEDVAQTVFMRLGTVENVPAKNPAGYLYRAAINGALDLLRRRRVALLEPLETAMGIASEGVESEPERVLSSRELATLLRQALGELPVRAAEMFTLRYIEELGNREIAMLMGTSSAVVAVTLHQTRSKLKKRLKALEREKS